MPITATSGTIDRNYDLSCQNIFNTPGLDVIKLFSCSTQLSMKFILLIKTTILKSNEFQCLKQSDVVFFMLINVKMPTID